MSVRALNREYWGIFANSKQLGPIFKMIGKFIFFGLLISAPLAITGLKCWNTETLGEEPSLLDCPTGDVCGKTILFNTGNKSL